MLANIADPNTEADKTRGLTLKFTFKPLDDRSGAIVSFSCRPVLQPVKDDGVSQHTTVKQGISLKENVTVKGRVTLSHFEEERALSLKCQPATLRRCLKCEWWMRSTGPDHRLCNPCKGLVSYRGRDGTRVKVPR